MRKNFNHRKKASRTRFVYSGVLFFAFFFLTPLVLRAQDTPKIPGSALPNILEEQKEKYGPEQKPADDYSDALFLPDSLPDQEAPPALPAGLPVDPTTTDMSLGQAQAASPQAQEDVRAQAFDAALQGLLPLRPEEIRKLLEHFDRTQESVETPVYPPPKPEVTVETLSLDPGVPPKTIKLSYGYVTTVNMVDSSGAPWPIENITWAGNFDVVQVSTREESSDDEQSTGAYSNILRITPQSEFAFGNISISMIGLKTPIIISLQTNRDVVHYRFDAIVPDRGPFASTPLIDKGPGGSSGAGLDLVAGNIEMSAILEGVPPPGAVKLNVSGVDSRTSAYRNAGLTFLRTPLTLLSPNWVSSVSSSDGMKVYAINQAPVVLLSDKGKTVRARLTDREDLFDEQ